MVPSINKPFMRKAMLFYSFMLSGCVDSYVGRTIFNKCVCGLLKDMTVVLVTQQLPYVKVADQVLVMQDVSICVQP